MTHHLMFLMAAATDTSTIAIALKDAAQDVVLFPDDQEKKEHLVMHAMMFMLHHQSGGDVSKAMQMAKDVDNREKKLSMFDIEDLLN
jgi:hypothetical protein